MKECEQRSQRISKPSCTAHVIPGFRVTRVESRPRRQYALRTEPSFRATAVVLVLPPYPSPPSTADIKHNFHLHPHLDSPAKFLPPFSSFVFSHPIRTSLPKIASPVPVKHWSNFEVILEWQERTSDALDDGFYSDEAVSTNVPAPLPILNATVRENNRRRDWAAYRKVVEADPNTTIAPPWPPFVAPPLPSPSPEPSISSLWQDSPSPPDMRLGHRKLNSKTSPLALANDGYAWWKYVLEASTSTPSSPRRVVGGPASRSDSEDLAFGAFSDIAGTGSSPASGSSSGGCSLALTTPTGAEDAGAVRVELAAAAASAAAGPDDDLAACIAQMLLECRVDAELEPIEEEEYEEDSLVDGHVYDCGLEKEIQARAAVAQQLNWMLMGVLPMG